MISDAIRSYAASLNTKLIHHTQGRLPKSGLTFDALKRESR